MRDRVYLMFIWSEENDGETNDTPEDDEPLENVISEAPFENFKKLDLDAKDAIKRGKSGIDGEGAGEELSKRDAGDEDETKVDEEGVHPGALNLHWMDIHE
jgi:hypothetical protein